METEGK